MSELSVPSGARRSLGSGAYTDVAHGVLPLCGMLPEFWLATIVPSLAYDRLKSIQIFSMVNNKLWSVCWYCRSVRLTWNTRVSLQRAAVHTARSTCDTDTAYMLPLWVVHYVLHRLSNYAWPWPLSLMWRTVIALRLCFVRKCFFVSVCLL